MVEPTNQAQLFEQRVETMAQLRTWSRKRIAQLRSDEDAQGLAEYALILTLIAVACVAALGALGGAIAGSPGFQLF